jgi:sensor histidine kinase YesM
MKGSFLTFFLFTASFLFCDAQSFRFTQYTTHNGLPIDNVYAAAQDEYGYIWFATDFGISKFDGYRFVNYYKNSGMANKAVTDIVYAGGDSLLFLSYPNTIQSIHINGTIRTIAQCNNFSVQQLIRHNNRYYFYQREFSTIGILENGNTAIVTLDSLLQGSGLLLHAVFPVNKTTVAFCTNKGLYMRSEKQTKLLLPNTDVTFGLTGKNHVITAISNSAVVEIDTAYTVSRTKIKIPGAVPIYHMTEDKDGVIWLRGMVNGIFRLQHNRLQEMSAALSMQNKIINEFFIDARGNAWFCTDGSGVLFKRANTLKVYETSDGLANNRVLQLLLHNNELFIGTSNGLSVRSKNTIKKINLPSVAKGLKWVYYLKDLADNQIGIAGATMFNFSEGDSTLRLLKNKRIDGYTFTAFNGFAGMQQNDSVYWTASYGNIERIVNNKRSVNYKLTAVGARKTYDMLFHQGKLWVGTENGIVFLENNRLSLQDSINGVRPGQVFRFLVNKKGVLWAATENGLFYNDGVWKQVRRGATYGSNYCTGITEDGEGRIWCSTWDGFFITDGVARANFNTADGLPSKTCNSILYDSSLNAVYIGTDNGLTIAECSKLQQQQLFQQVYISCTYEDSAAVLNNGVLESNKNNLRFYFNLDNNKWLTTQLPDLFLTDISREKHTLEVRAKINGTVITSANTSFSFSIKERFYKTWWFWTLVVLLLQYIAFRLISNYNKRKRATQLLAQKQQAELASLKQQAFTSLMNPHFIFNALNSIQYYINKQDRQTANKYLSDFATLVRRSFDAAQKPFVTLDEELETIRLYLQLEKMRFTDKFDYSITLNDAAEEEEWLLPGMVLQPFLENAILHGLAPLQSHGQITIDIKGANNILYITITDNGIGMKKSKQLHVARKHSSRGMQLIKERLEILSNKSVRRVQLTISDLNPAAENPGTRIELVIPQEVYFQNNAAK